MGPRHLWTRGVCGGRIVFSSLAIRVVWLGRVGLELLRVVSRAVGAEWHPRGAVVPCEATAATSYVYAKNEEGDEGEDNTS